MIAGERLAVRFRFANTGTETWPADGAAGPPIRASYRWHAHGRIVVADGLSWKGEERY